MCVDTRKVGRIDVVEQRRSRPTRSIWTITVVGGLVAAAVFLLFVRTVPAPGRHLPIFLLIALFAVSEIAVVQVEVGSKVTTHSFVEIPLVLGLVATTPPELIGAWLLGGALTLGVVRRQPPIKLAYNVVSFAVQGVAAVLVFHAFSDGRHLLAAATAVGAVAACGAASLVSTASVLAAVALTEGPRSARARVRYALVGVVSSAATAATMLIGVILQQTDAAVLWLLALPIAGIFVLERALVLQVREQRRRVAGPTGVEATSLAVDDRPTLDPLTGLANRTGLAYRLDWWIAAQGREDLACLHIDIDALDTVIERFGPGIGDQLLVVTAQRLAGSLRDGDVAARLSGDHFAVAARVNPENPIGEAQALGERIADYLSRPASLGEHTVVADTRVGIVLGRDGDRADDLLDCGGRALAAAANADGRVHVLTAARQTDAVAT
jgi:diguanylate cyclase (GGDEF)-like protein